MKTLFQIGGEQPDRQSLLLEIGPDHAMAAIANPDMQEIFSLEYVGLDEWDHENELVRMLKAYRDRSFSQVTVSVSFPETFLTPRKMEAATRALMPVCFEQPGQVVHADAINEWQVCAVYGLPGWLVKTVEENLGQVKWIHVFSPLLRKSHVFVADVQLSVHFGTSRFHVVAKKGTALQLAQIYSYKTPLDVVYYLLKICSELQIKQAETTVVLSGLVEQNSALFKELHHYFEHLQFAKAPALHMPAHELPVHFFTSLYNLVACES